jgi:hypothetical protein
MAKHRLTKSKRGPYFVLIGPYDERVIEAIKSLPVPARSWDPGLKAWKIVEGHEGEAQALLDEIDQERDGSTTPISQQSAPSRSTTPTRRSAARGSAATSPTSSQPPRPVSSGRRSAG